MTQRERFIKTLKCEAIGGQVPTFELVFFLTMEAFGKVHPSHRSYSQWNQMSKEEQRLHIRDIAEIHIQTAERYGHSAIFVCPNVEPSCKNDEMARRILEEIRALSGDEYYLTLHGDVTHAIPNGDSMMDFSVMMYEEPDKLHEISKRRMEQMMEFASTINRNGHLVDGFTLCSDYCFNVNPFFNPELFEEHIVPYLSASIAEYRRMGYYTIKHTDGNIMPILKQLADCKPDAIHSLDPQGGVSIPEVRKVIGDDICLVGNVNCGLLQTGTVEECRIDTMRSLREGMDKGRGYIFSTSNCAYTGMPLARYEMMNDIWKQHGRYPF